MRSRFGFRLRQRRHHGAKTGERAASEKSIVGGANELNGNVVGRMAILSEVQLRWFGAAGEQFRGMKIVARDGLSNFVQNYEGILEMESLADAESLELA